MLTRLVFLLLLFLFILAAEPAGGAEKDDGMTLQETALYRALAKDEALSRSYHNLAQRLRMAGRLSEADSLVAEMQERFQDDINFNLSARMLQYSACEVEIPVFSQNLEWYNEVAVKAVESRGLANALRFVNRPRGLRVAVIGPFEDEKDAESLKEVLAENAEGWFIDIVRCRHNTADYQLGRAWGAWQEGQRDVALEWFRKAGELHPQLPELAAALDFVGLTHTPQNAPPELDEATNALLQEVEAAKANEEPLVESALRDMDLFLRHGREKEAFALYLKLTSIFPDHFSAAQRAEDLLGERHFLEIFTTHCFDTTPYDGQKIAETLPLRLGFEPAKLHALEHPISRTAVVAGPYESIGEAEAARDAINELGLSGAQIPIRLGERDADFYLKHGWSAWRNGRPKDAEIAFGLALRKAPELPPAQAAQRFLQARMAD